MAGKGEGLKKFKKIMRKILRRRERGVLRFLTKRKKGR